MQPELVARAPAGKAFATPLVFVHGAWHGPWCWERHFLDYFSAKGYSCYAITLRNHGTGPVHRPRGSRIADYVQDLSAAVEALSAPPVLIGHSMGGFVVQKYLEGARPAGVALLASVPPQGVLATTLRIMRRFPLQFLRANLTMRLYPLVESEELCRHFFLSESIDPDVLREVTQKVVDESYLAFLDMLALTLPRAKTAPPMIVLGGAEDTIFRPREVERTAERYGADLQILPGLAHDLMLDTGWKAAADALAGWLEARGFASTSAPVGR